MTARPVLAAVVVALLLVRSPPARGHAFLEHAEPHVGSTVGATPPSITLTFTEEIEAAFSKVELTDASGRRIETGALEHPESNVLTVSLPGLVPGSYTVNWSVVSVDTHATDGHFTFTVKGS